MNRMLLHYDAVKDKLKNPKDIEQLDLLIEEVMYATSGDDSFNEYQLFAARGIRPESQGKNLLVGFALGLGGESGEVIDDIKKVEYHGRNIPIEHTAEELGDVLWYVANLATQLGYSLKDVVSNNKEKLRNRYPELYCKEDLE